MAFNAIRVQTGDSSRTANIDRIISLLYFFLCPSDEVRATSGLSTNLYKKTDYDRLALSLTSPMPNEQDFGINVCTLLSNEGRHTLKLEKCERLLDLLLAHAGVFNHRK